MFRKTEAWMNETSLDVDLYLPNTSQQVHHQNHPYVLSKRMHEWSHYQTKHQECHTLVHSQQDLQYPLKNAPWHFQDTMHRRLHSQMPSLSCHSQHHFLKENLYQ